MRSRILILYGTTEGHTRKVSSAIAATLREAGVDSDVINAAAKEIDPNPADYDAVIVAASIHAGGYQRAVTQWVRAHAAELGTRPTALVTVCLSVVKRSAKVDQDLAAILDRFVIATKWWPGETKYVAGALPYTRYGWLTRWMMRRIVAKQGGDTDTSRDYEYTDWKDLAEFARGVAAKVQRTTPRAALAG